jgi:hypothetical protein
VVVPIAKGSRRQWPPEGITDQRPMRLLEVRINSRLPSGDQAIPQALVFLNGTRTNPTCRPEDL